MCVCGATLPSSVRHRDPQQILTLHLSLCQGTLSIPSHWMPVCPPVSSPPKHSFSCVLHSSRSEFGSLWLLQVPRAVPSALGNKSGSRADTCAAQTMQQIQQFDEEGLASGFHSALATSWEGKDGHPTNHRTDMLRYSWPVRPRKTNLLMAPVPHLKPLKSTGNVCLSLPPFLWLFAYVSLTQ